MNCRNNQSLVLEKKEKKKTHESQGSDHTSSEWCKSSEKKEDEDKPLKSNTSDGMMEPKKNKSQKIKKNKPTQRSSIKKDAKNCKPTPPEGNSKASLEPTKICR